MAPPPRHLCLDLELDRRGGLRALGASLDGRELRCEVPSAARADAALDELEWFAAGAERVLGHNLLGHDLPWIAARRPAARVCALPVADTLFLSPLAFPRKPYHHLVKDDRLRDEINDPVADAALAARLFADEVAAFTELAARDPDLCALLAWALAPELGEAGARGCGDPPAAAVAEAPGLLPLAIRPGRPVARAADRGGLRATLLACGARALGPGEAGPLLRARIAAAGCAAAAARSAGELGGTAAGRSPELAYALSWLAVAGGESVVPAWVRHAFPGVRALIAAWRETPCAEGCAFCADAHSATGQLRRWFGFEAFRREPRGADGRGLQQAIVEHGMRGGSHLAVLPTGAGKSLCFQLPAFVRHRRSGALTVVVSPLQALMKDQVDGLVRRTQSTAAAALNGSLTPPERGDVLERVRVGEVAILYVSPEQLRNRSFRRVVGQREIGAWVFDEAHCLSKWGHDFRPDYLYASRFIAELAARQGVAVPPIACVTATARHEVADEIAAHFRERLGIELARFEGGVERDNLAMRVERVPAPVKYARVHELVEAALVEPGSVVVYCPTRREADDLAAFLQRGGLPAISYHAGLTAADRRDRQDRFLGGELRVVCATNAFGMGVDKDDVRLVVHQAMPGSLESYLQEAGRAGRDRRPADCVLLWSPDDAETQFRLASLGRLDRNDIAELLRALRRARRGRREEIVVTAGQLLRDERTDVSFGVHDRDAATRVVTALAWLERGEFVRRDENCNGVVQGVPLVRTLEEFDARTAALDLPPLRREMWREVLRALLAADADEGLSADDIAASEPFRRFERGGDDRSADREVFRVVQAMTAAGLLRGGVQLTAFVRHKVQDPSVQRCADVADVERALLDLLRAAAPDADQCDSGSGGYGPWQELSLRRVNQRLLDRGLPSSVARVRAILSSLSGEGRGRLGGRGCLELRHAGGDRFRLRLAASWDEVVATARARQAVAEVALRAVLACVPAGARPSKELLVAFGYGDLQAALRADLTLRAGRSVGGDDQAALDRALLYLHDLQVVILQRGLAVFRQAMTLAVTAPAGRRYTPADFRPLHDHYERQTAAVHVMGRYAELGTAEPESASALVRDYFALDTAEFERRHFAASRAALRRRTGAASYEAIVGALGNAAQQAVVTAPDRQNLLVLAGPGAGKTRVVVHRCAYLLRVRRVPAAAIAVLCFNRATALELRRRLRALAGDDARGVTVHTFHGLAARLCGRSFADRSGVEAVGEHELAALLDEAAELLEGRRALPGADDDEQRDVLLAGFRHVLVDEYQDVDARQYRLVSALAGRVPGGRRLTVLAVGDDDQGIYGWRGADASFLHRFVADYGAATHFLVENWRSTAAIVAAANRVIAGVDGRLKAAHPIRVDDGRRHDDPGGALAAADPIARGRVQVLRACGAAGQAAAAADELLRLRAVAGGERTPSAAVLAWRRDSAAPVRAILEDRGVAVRWVDDDAGFHPRALREAVAFLAALRALPGAATVDELRARRAGCASHDPGSPWWRYLDDLVDAFAAEIGDGAAAPATVEEFLLETMAEHRRTHAAAAGVHVGTVHGCKGLEFDHVVVLDGFDVPAAERDEARRLFYVAMTRARHALVLLARDDLHHPFIAAVRGGDVLERDAPPPAARPSAAVLATRYESIGLRGLFLDFAGRQPPDDPIHGRLAALRVGDALRLAAEGPRVLLVDGSGEPVAQLADNEFGAGRWRDRLARVDRAVVRAVLHRRRADAQPGFRERCVGEAWEVPLVEVAWRGG